MTKYLVYVPYTFDSVFMVEAASPEEAKKKISTGDFDYESDYLYDTDPSDTGGELQVEEADDE